MTMLKVLTVQYDRTHLAQLEAVLGPQGCVLVSRPDCAGAAALLAEERVHGIFIDLRSPDQREFDLIRRARRSFLQAVAPVVLVTAREDAEVMRLGFQAGANFTLAKPVTAERLRNLMAVLRGCMVKAQVWHARVPFQTPVKVIRGPQSFQTPSVNLSEHGMLVDGTGPLGVGERVGVEFALPCSKLPIRAQARVIRRDPQERVGLHFFDLNPDHQQTLRRFLSDRLGA
ncbi:MAG: PilZ domain-containing protein [Terriglobales bacterium]